MLALIFALLSSLWARPHGYEPCSHAPDQPAPARDRHQQAQVRAAIAAAVSEVGGSPAFTAYLTAVAGRESSFRPGIIHVRDAAHSTAAYRHKRRSLIAAGNPHARRPELWLTYGLFGLNSNYYSTALHPHADPRQLCSTRVSVATYAKAGQRVLRRMPRACGIDQPTWADLHRAIQGGHICPDGGRERIPKTLAASPVSLADLGG